ncbi:winged helix DNA-binding domain-containing protein [Ornithinicoccus halotolerans]|uniref:winged helix DNA-binding domain-containing protein n=1 Tax=Ornithinicoccus halotolerans TaxID=1748220 RepID=UPI001296E857|nr:winged helix DNA-binding domain-containing protein [Ornithinicoccus halotolerans]
MRARDVLRQRLSTQRLTATPLPSAADVVALLGCVQSQERDHAFFSLGLRTHGATHADVTAEYNEGGFLRTHILRPTWHFVRPEDLRWMLALTSPRVEASMAARHRQLGLDDPRHVGRALDALTDLLSGRSYRTRTEIGEAFARHPGLPRAGPQLGHLLLLAELRGLVCSGPLRGAHHSYALVEEVVPPAPELAREEALDRLVRRFFAGHGPASAQDFARWSSLTVTDTRAALAGTGDDLERVEVDGTTLWFDPAARARARPGAPSTFLLPVYDEAVLSYRQLSFPAAPGHPYAERPDPFWAWIIQDGTNVGLWKRTVGARRVTVEARVATSLQASARESVQAAAQRLADFLGRELDYREREGRPQLWGGERGHPATRRRRPARG